jgi:cytochrome c oxidase cbb3-type subunit I/II
MSDQQTNGGSGEHWHRRFFERNLGTLAVATTIVIMIGGLVEIVPMFTAKGGPEPLAGVTPYTPLEVAGRDIYIREGCHVCHSQWIRPMRAELLRYGEWTRAGEYSYDRPFLMGSRRIGPDLQRVGGKYPDAWHYEHMRDPRSTTPGSTMPAYAWLLKDRYRIDDVRASVRALRRAGVPYTNEEVDQLPASISAQARDIVASLAGAGISTAEDREIIALIAYLQRLGVDGRRAIEAQQALEPRFDGGAISAAPAADGATR